MERQFTEEIESLKLGDGQVFSSDITSSQQRDEVSLL
jgi:hypothetical protein